MRAICDPCERLSEGLAAIRRQYSVPADFPTEVLHAAQDKANRFPSAHADRTDRRFLTLDPAESTDLDQAFAIERAGEDLILHYAIADIGWFVDEGDPIDREAWARGATLYLPDGKAPLYPPVLSQAAASLLPDGPRPAVIFTMIVDPAGKARLDRVERAIVRSRAKLGYADVRDEDLPANFPELAGRIQAAEERRGATRVDPPQQVVVSTGEGRYALDFRPMWTAERRNAAMSLACNLAIAELLVGHRTGLFRVMGEPDARAVRRLRQTARAFDIAWPDDMSLDSLERRLDPNRAKDAAFMMAIRRAGPPAGYLPWQETKAPWHSAVAAPYAHATAPLRRLADRYVIAAALALANDQAVPDEMTAAFELLPKAMARSDSLAAQIDRAAIDLAEAVMLESRVSERFEAIVTDVDDRGARIQLRDLPVVARVNAHRVSPGDPLQVRLVEADPERRSIRFERLS